MTADEIPTDLPELPPLPDEANMAAPGDDPEAAVKKGYPRLDVARKLQRQVAFLQHFRETGVVVTACRLTGISTRLVYGFWRKDPLFEAAYQEAMVEAADVVEEELFRRGVRGVDEVVTHMGLPTMIEDDEGVQRVFTVKKYSDGCLMALIKARKPEKFADRVKADVNVTGASGVLVVPGSVDPETWAKAAEAQQAKFRPEDKGGPK